MAVRSGDSSALRRLQRAGPTTAEIDLLRCATLDGVRAEAAWRRWASTHPIDDTARYPVELLPAVSSNLTADALGGDADRLRGLRRRVWADSHARSTALCGAVEAMASIGVAPIVTGGAALATTVFTTAGTRPWGPVDLVLGDTDLDEVVQVLRPLGWTRMRHATSPFDQAVHVVDEGDRLVRMHRWLLFPGFVGVPERQWEQRSRRHDLPGCSLRRLRMSDELVAIVLIGLMGDPTARARWPLDVVHLSRNSSSVERIDPDEFWREVVASAAEVGAGPVIADALQMCRNELDAPVPEAVVDELAAASLDRHLRRRWALQRRGITPEWRTVRYRRTCRERGVRPTARGYVSARYAALSAKGVGASAGDRIDRVKRYVADRRVN